MLAGLLPAPKNVSLSSNRSAAPSGQQQMAPPPPRAPPGTTAIPAYPNRKGFLPRNVTDFGDGGAYPEIHVVQYPLNMGKPGRSNSALVPVQLDTNGQLQTDLLVKQGANRNKLVQSQMSDIKPKKAEKLSIALPDEEEEMETAERTRIALEALLNGKIASSKGSTVKGLSEQPEAAFIRYTPNADAPGFNPNAKQRVIKMVEAQVDPMEPPKHKHVKVPRGPPSPPVPVLHSPPRKLTVEDQQAWKIPPCISNWKNARGFIIPLDKRLAADGRGLQENTINDKFASFSEALYITERKAAEDLQVRNQIRKKMAMRQKGEREEELREMANRARMERAGVSAATPSDSGFDGAGAVDNDGAGGGGWDHYGPNGGDRGGRGGGRRGDYDDHDDGDGMGKYGRGRDSEGGERGGGRGEGARRHHQQEEEEQEQEDVEAFDHETEDERIAREQRERMRLEKRKEREREMRIENMKGNMRKKKADRDEGRDVSEKIALGMLRGSGASKLSGEALYDSRLFNQSAGLDAGFGAEDEYSTYTKPLFDRGGDAGSSRSSIYRPRNGGGDGDVYGDAEADAELAKLSDTSRFKADKGFKGAEGYGRGGGGRREAPVQFERKSDRDLIDNDDDEENGDDDGKREVSGRRERGGVARVRGRDDSPPPRERERERGGRERSGDRDGGRDRFSDRESDRNRGRDRSRDRSRDRERSSRRGGDHDRGRKDRSRGDDDWDEEGRSKRSRRH